MSTGERILNISPRWLLDDPSRNGTDNGCQQTLKKAQGSLHNGRDNTDHCEEQGLEEVQQTVNRKDPLDTEYYTISHSEADDPPHFWPADIIGSTTAKAGNDVLLKCNTFDRGVSNSEIHMYLCKDGVGVMMEPLVNKDEYTFTLRRVTVMDSGNYSCVYSIKKHLARNVTASGKNSVYVQVTGKRWHQCYNHITLILS
ncbi:hypothetical protein NFI96_028028 [Prochilodus magdalenae]|nr:hypothetical protein NFI96_028028 [Prochilodus magdalenae]